MKNQLKEYLQSVKNFSGSVLVAKQGEIILKESYGYADKEYDLKNTPQTTFGIGSITKSFTALSIMQLVEKNLIELTEKISEFIPNVFEGKEVKIHQLLSHTSGIRNYIYYKEMQTGEEFTPSQIIDFMSSKPFKFEPGQGWLYSNTNYVILGQIIEKVTGKTYHEYVQENILNPLGMKNTYFDGEKSVNQAKHGKSVFDCRPSLLYAAGDIISNVEDLYLYDQALYSEKLLSKDSIKTMQKAAFDGRMIKYGYGWFIKDLFNQRSVCHGGFHPIGYTSHIERYVNDGTVIIVLSNVLEKSSPLGIKYFNSCDLSRELASRIFEKKVWFWQKMS